MVRLKVELSGGVQKQPSHEAPPRKKRSQFAGDDCKRGVIETCLLSQGHVP